MSTTMTLRHGSSLETRPSLIQRLQSGEDQGSWQDFYAIYGGLMRAFAAKAGLTPEEAEEVVQETAIGVSRGLPEFIYDPTVCRFKTWLLNQTRWQILRQLKPAPIPSQPPGPLPLPSDRPVDRIHAIRRRRETLLRAFPIRRFQTLERSDREWEKGLLACALERVGQQIDEHQFQIFDLYVTKAWPAGRVAKMLGVSVARVYLTKHRIAVLMKKEVRRLEREAEKTLRNLLCSSDSIRGTSFVSRFVPMWTHLESLGHLHPLPVEQAQKGLLWRARVARLPIPPRGLDDQQLAIPEALLLSFVSRERGLQVERQSPTARNDV